jgi:hypothetical protein
VSTLILKFLRHARKKSRLHLIGHLHACVKSLIPKDDFLNIAAGIIANRFSASQEIKIVLRKGGGSVTIFCPFPDRRPPLFFGKIGVTLLPEQRILLASGARCRAGVSAIVTKRDHLP